MIRTIQRSAVALLVGLLVAAVSALAPTAAPTASAQDGGEVYPVPASGSWAVNGAGWGHGHGMSQWGSQGAALQGVAHRDILSFYYPGTQFGFVANPHIRVQLTKYAGSSIFFGSVNGETLTARDAASGQIINLPPAARYLLTIDANGMALGQWTGSGWAPIHFPGMPTVTGPVEMLGSSGTWVYDSGLKAGTQYPGGLRVVRTSQTAGQAVNVLYLDDYLRGVVPRESPSSWHQEALRAQSVAARSYALSVSQAGGSWDLCDTTQCQVYSGQRSVNASGAVTNLWAQSTNEAVDATSGVVVAYQNAPAFTQFSSSNGGYSVAGSRPYLVAKADPYSGSAPGDPVTRWSDTLPVARVQQHCPSGGTLQRMVIESRDGRGPFGGRITALRVECSTGNARITGTTALAMGMRHRMWQPTGGSTGGGGGTAGANPKGNVEALQARGTTVELSGWAFDPDTTDPIEVHVYVDNGGTNLGPAAIPRPDVARAFPGAGENHGFSATVSIGSGPRRVCVYAINVGGGSHTLLTCRDVVGSSGDARGNAEQVTQARELGHLWLVGWALDPDTTAPIEVHAYVDGGGYNLGLADVSRPDVARAFPGYGDRHGFNEILNVGSGVHQVCLYAINVGAGHHGNLGCRQVTVSGDPIGNVETIAGGAGTIQVAGWALDPDTSSPIDVHVYIDGGGHNLGPANLERQDVARIYGRGAQHGFSRSFNVAPGSHEVCVYAINVGFGQHRGIRCQTVRVS
jgi:SpoIID/LytB domain protein